MSAITCPMCDEQVPLARGLGAPGEKQFQCSNGHTFGPGVRHRAAAEQPAR